MTWTKLPDEHDQTQPLVDLSDGGYRLYVDGLVYANRHRTDGFVPNGAVRTVSPTYRPGLLSELVARGLWLRKPGGYQIHDFLRFQLSKAQLDDLKRRRSDSGRLGGLRSGEVRSSRARSNGEPTAEAFASPDDGHQRTPYPTPDPVPDRYIETSRWSGAGRLAGLRHVGAAAARIGADAESNSAPP